MEVIETIKPGNIMISKTLHSYLGNFVITKTTSVCYIMTFSNVLINEKFIPKLIGFQKVLLTSAPITNNIDNDSKESEKYKSVITI